MADGLTGPDLGALLRELKAVDAKATTLLRRNIRNAAKVAAEDVVEKVREDPPDDNPKITAGSREAIARGINVRINTGAKSKTQGASIVGSSKNLPAERKAMLRLYNKTSWRHPVFDKTERADGIAGFFGARKKVWVVQQGRPFFGAVLEKHTDDVQRAIKAAVDEANAALLRAK